MEKVYVSSVIDAPAAIVWDKIRDFNALPSWVPGVIASTIESDLRSDVIGCVRVLTVKDGERIREKLLALSDIERMCSYNILSAALPIKNFLATLHVRPITDGARTFIEWTATFECTDHRGPEIVEAIGQGVFQRGFDSLKAYYSHGRRTHGSG